MLKYLFNITALVTCVISLGYYDCWAQNMTVRDALHKIRIISYSSEAPSVVNTVMEELKKELSTEVRIVHSTNVSSLKNQKKFHIASADKRLAEVSKKFGFTPPQNKDWMFFRLTSTGEGALLASKSYLLYTLFCRIKEEWIVQDISLFENGRLDTTAFRWLEGGDGLFTVFRPLAVRNYDPETSVKELARIGCSHISVNGLATPFPYEQGPPGEIYYRFYLSSPDLDQFVETKLNEGIYPPEYLQANLNLLKKNASLALKYGLTPGLIICAPRTVPESLFERYPFLRGARVDQSFRSFRPRYTLTLAHPVVRWHYAQLMRKLLKEVPELGYVYIWTNDSGSGFEYTTTTYPGRNGGPYLVREWKSDEEIAKIAGENVLRYYRLLRDAASEINPEFRVITGLGSFPAEGETILKGMGNRIDLMVSPSDKADEEQWQKKQALLNKDSYLFSGVSLVSNYVQGIPFPWLANERLQELISVGLNKGMVTVDPPSLAPYCINRKILQSFQMNYPATVDEIVDKEAKRLVGPEKASNLVKAWRLTDEAVRSFPGVPLYQERWAFAPYRLWVRLMVPNIEKIPKTEREYYEKYMLSIFNNPTFVDLTADALWVLMTTDQAEKIVEQFDKVWKPLDKAITLLEKECENVINDSPAYSILVDQRDRLVGLRCHFRTLRNTAAWIAGVHGYSEAKDEKTKKSRRKTVHDMVLDEIENTKALLKLWQNSSTDFIPISTMGETMMIYGENFGELLQRKIELMTGREDDEPYINPNFMWQMPNGFDVEMREYLKY